MKIMCPDKVMSGALLKRCTAQWLFVLREGEGEIEIERERGREL